jgi:hypothetical protein
LAVEVLWGAVLGRFYWHQSFPGRLERLTVHLSQAARDGKLGWMDASSIVFNGAASSREIHRNLYSVRPAVQGVLQETKNDGI